MRKLLSLALLLVMLIGCGKFTDTSLQPGEKPEIMPDKPSFKNSGTQQPQVHAPTGVVINPGLGGGGSGGAVQAVRKAVGRSVDQKSLKDLQLFMNQASLANGRMPAPQEILQAIQRDLPKVAAAIRDGTLVLPPVRRGREGVWAYEKAAMTQGGQVLTSSGIQRLTPQQLLEQLKLAGQMPERRAPGRSAPGYQVPGRRP